MTDFLFGLPPGLLVLFGFLFSFLGYWLTVFSIENAFLSFAYSVIRIVMLVIVSILSIRVVAGDMGDVASNISAIIVAVLFSLGALLGLLAAIYTAKK